MMRIIYFTLALLASVSLAHAVDVTFAFGNQDRKSVV